MKANYLKWRRQNGEINLLPALPAQWLKGSVTGLLASGAATVNLDWKMGERIFTEEQQENERANYGSYLIRNLAEEIEPEYGSGFSGRQLERCRQFYRTFPIASTLRTQLNWSQYKMLISNEEIRK